MWLGPLAEPPPPGSANRKGRGPGSQEPGHQRSVGVSAPSCPPLLPSGRLPQAEGVGSSGVPATLCSGQPDATSTPRASRWFLTVPTALSPRCCTRASPPPFRAFAGGEEPQRGQSAPFSQTGLCLPHGCADGSSVPVLDTVWSSPGDESGDRPVVPGAQEWTGGWAAPRTS